jgi:hypothetical protein
MNNKLYSSLTELVDNNDLRSFAEELDTHLASPSLLADDHGSSLYHKFASCSLHEKYLFPFVENLRQAVRTRFSDKENELLLNRQNSIDDEFTPLHMAIFHGKQVKNI